MILLSHIIIALLSVAYSLYTYFYPSDTKLKAASWLVGATVGTGTLLVLSLRTQLVRACLTGLLFVGLSILGIIAARRKLAYETTRE
jgi:hypothetical protein